ncbi:signal peptidase I [Sphingomonas baiyangensis]|uniref:Signal peptidase I n=1 Tax=Sphingomonas baiyangensis TaxID=2572576 RepID=A0A4U1L8P3_9SPHN|nr:signal peptidase I [Sphingomonas baiyangensis]TKD53341.1 signal peptidase I [Sphingomonas baiyangensis]
MANPARARRASSTQKSEWRETLVFLVKLALFVFVIRSFLFSPFVIPSGSMLPRTLIGDYLFITKWNYGYSRHSLPLSLPLIPGRILPSTPERGDVAVFKAPPADNEDWIKRVIGLPGDTIQMRGGQLILNGRAVPKQRIADFVLPVTPNFGCEAVFQDDDAEGRPICRYPQYRETLPGGRSYLVLDQGFSPADDTGVFTVPAGHVFMMGDNRDDSKDSRFADSIGFVPLENLQGKAVVTFWSTDGSASWLKPWTWPGATRWSRIGEGF